LEDSRTDTMGTGLSPRPKQIRRLEHLVKMEIGQYRMESAKCRTNLDLYVRKWNIAKEVVRRQTIPPLTATKQKKKKSKTYLLES